MRLTDLEKLEIIVMFRSGKFTIKEIAEWIGCCKETVNKVIDKEREKGIRL